MLIKQRFQALHIEFPNRNTNGCLLAFRSFHNIEIRVLSAVVKPFDFALDPQAFAKRLFQHPVHKVDVLTDRQREFFVAHRYP